MKYRILKGDQASAVLIYYIGISQFMLTDKLVNPRGDHWAEFGPRDQCRLCARPKFGMTL